MIRLALFTAALGSALYWLSSLTALPDVKPLDTSELPRLLRENEDALIPKGAAPTAPSGATALSLRQALEIAIRRVELQRKRSFFGLGGLSGFGGPTALSLRLASFPIDGLSPELSEAVRAPDADLTRVAELALKDTEALSRERLDQHTDERSRLLRLSLEATREKDPGLEPSAPTWLNVGLRNLEVPTEPDARDPVQVELVRDAATLVARFTPDPGKRVSLYQKLETIHSSPVIQGEIHQILVAPQGLPSGSAPSN